MSETRNNRWNSLQAVRDRYSERIQTNNRIRNENAREAQQIETTRAPLADFDGDVIFGNGTGEWIRDIREPSTRPVSFFSTVEGTGARPTEDTPVEVTRTPAPPPPPLEAIPPRGRPATNETSPFRINNLAGLNAEGVITAGTLNLNANTFRINREGDAEINRNPWHYTGRDSNAFFEENLIRESIQTEPQIVFSHPIEKQLIKFLKEKLTLNINATQAGKGIEIKVSLNLAESNKELLSDSDFVELS